MMLSTCTHSMPYSKRLIDYCTNTTSLQRNLKISTNLNKKVTAEANLIFKQKMNDTCSQDFKYVVDANWNAIEDIFNGNKGAQLALAVAVNNSKAAKELIQDHFVSPQYSLDQYLMSTVAFDENFTLGKYLLRQGAEIKSSILTNLLWSVQINIDRVQKGNYSDTELNRIKHYHFNHLYEKVEWIFKHGEIDKDVVNFVLFEAVKSCLYSYKNCDDVSDSAIRPLILLLLKHSTDVSYKDQDGINLMHWAALKQCEDEVIVRLKQKGLDYFEMDNYGITPYEYALLNMNRSLLTCMRPEISAEETLNQLPSDFAGKLLAQLPENIRIHVGLPALLHEDFLCQGQRESLALYRPMLVYSKHFNIQYATPMGEAIKQHDLKKVLELINSGWNISNENAFAKDFEISSEYLQGGLTSFREGFYAAFGYLNNAKDPFCNSILKALNDLETTGFTLSSEFNYAFFHLGKKFPDNYIFALLYAGLTGDDYYEHTQQDLEEIINRYRAPEFDNYDGNLNIKAIRSFIKSLYEPENSIFAKNLPRKKTLDIESESNAGLSLHEFQRIIEDMQSLGGKVLE